MYKILNNCIYFDIVARALSAVLEELAVEHRVVQTIDAADAGRSDVTYIVFTTHHLHEPMPKRYISYNFEQLITAKAWPREFFDRLERAVQVWDYSMANIQQTLSKHPKIQPKVVHVPMGYHPVMDRLTPEQWLPASKRPVRWSMVGALNETRMGKLSRLLSASAPGSYELTNNCWGQEQTRSFARARVGINIHFYEGSTILEVHRIIPLVAHGVIVVSERSSDPWYDKEYAGVVTFVRTKGEAAYSLAEQDDLRKAVDIINNLPDDKLADLASARRRLLAERCSYTRYIQEALPHLASGWHLVSRLDADTLT